MKPEEKRIKEETLEQLGGRAHVRLEVVGSLNLLSWVLKALPTT